MAKRRMLSIEVIETDMFYLLPPSSQTLYLHINLNADDDGMVGNVHNLMRAVGTEKKYYRLLVERGYLIEFESGVVAVTDWRVHNRVRADRYTPTRYKEELSRLTLGEDMRYIKA